jgi:predicted nucleic acid-binding Zn ribbon protein
MRQYQYQRPIAHIPPRSARIKLTPSQSVVAEWRGVNLTEQEKALTKNTRSAADLIPAVLKGIGLDRKQSDVEILKVWNNLIDPAITKHAKPVGLAKGTLFVDVDSSVWLDEIVRYRRREILQRLRHSFGPDLIQRISFRASG